MIAFVGGPMDGQEISERLAGRYLEGPWPGRYEFASVVGMDTEGNVAVAPEYRYNGAFVRPQYPPAE